MDTAALVADLAALEEDLANARAILKEELKEAAAIAVEAAEKAAAKDLTIAKNLADAREAVKTAQSAIKRAEDFGAGMNELTKRLAAAQEAVDKAEKGTTAVSAYLVAAKKVPAAKKIKEKNRKLITAANKLYQELTANEKARADVKKANSAVKASLAVLNKPTITFNNKEVAKNLKKGTKSKWIKVKAGKKINLKAKASTGAKVTYKVKNPGVVTVNKKGLITAKKAGKAVVLVKCKEKTVEIRIRVK